MMPHLAEECFAALGGKGLAAERPWPAFDPALVMDSEITMPVQVNGKKRGDLTIARDADQGAVERAALELDFVQKALEGNAAQGDRRAAEDRQCRRLIGPCAGHCAAPPLFLCLALAAGLRLHGASRSIPTRRPTARRRRRPPTCRRSPSSRSSTRYAQEVRNHLIFLFNGGSGQPAAARYTLTLVVTALQNRPRWCRSATRTSQPPER